MQGNISANTASAGGGKNDSAGTGTANSAQASSLVSCKVTSHIVVPGKFVEAGNSGVESFNAAMQKFNDWVKAKSEEPDGKWKDSHSKTIAQINAIKQNIRPQFAADDPNNKQAWN